MLQAKSAPSHPMDSNHEQRLHRDRIAEAQKVADPGAVEVAGGQAGARGARGWAGRVRGVRLSGRWTGEEGVYDVFYAPRNKTSCVLWTRRRKSPCAAARLLPSTPG